MENKTEGDSGFTGINVTPLVDVSLVLVLIFMVTSPFFARPLMNVSLPSARSSESKENQNLAISLSPEKGIALNEAPVALNRLEKELKNRMKETGFTFVLIRADEQMSHGQVQDVLRIAKRAGAKRVAFATSPKVG